MLTPEEQKERKKEVNARYRDRLKNERQELEALDRINRTQTTKGTFFKDVCDKLEVILLIGGTGTGKTALSFKFLHSFNPAAISGDRLL